MTQVSGSQTLLFEPMFYVTSIQKAKTAYKYKITFSRTPTLSTIFLIRNSHRSVSGEPKHVPNLLRNKYLDQLYGAECFFFE
jgi:hypothetical protein